VPTKIGTATNWASVDAGRQHTLATRTDGTLWEWGGTAPRSPTQVGSGTTWKTVSAGNGTSFATRTDGTLWAWGSNHTGQLGDGTTTDRAAPTQIGGATGGRRRL
jgi:hypothetical protein